MSNTDQTASIPAATVQSPAEHQKKTPAKEKKTGVFRDYDGKASMKRISGFLALITGLGSVIYSLLTPGSEKISDTTLLIVLGFAASCFGMTSWEKIQRGKTGIGG